MGSALRMMSVPPDAPGTLNVKVEPPVPAAPPLERREG
jgi:hypothetical protein